MLKLLKRLLKFYFGFAVFHSLAKLLTFLHSVRRSRRLWKDLPGRNGDISGKEMQKHSKSINKLFLQDAINDPGHDLYRMPTPTPCLLFHSPRAVKWLLIDEFENFSKPHRGNMLAHFFSVVLGRFDSLVFSRVEYPEEKKAWTTQRKTASLVFTQRKFISLFHTTYLEKSNLVLKKLKEHNGSVLDIQKLFASFLMSSNEKILFGRDVDTITEIANSDFSVMFDTTQTSMAKALFDGMPLYQLSRILFPFPIGSLTIDERMPYMYNLTNFLYMTFDSQCQLLKKNVAELHRIVDNFIEDRLKNPNAHESNDMLSNFIKSKNKKWTKEEIRMVLLTFVLAGRETAGAGLSWLIYELTQNPEVQQKATEEIDRVLGNKVPSLAELSHENLPYLNGLIFEVLRYHPPVALNVKRAVKEMIFLDGTKIPKNSEVYYSGYAVGRDPTRYPDPHKILPERWIPFKKPELYDLPIFGAGKRTCIGKDMAQYQMKFVTVRLLQHFQFDLKEGEAEKISYSASFVNAIANNKEKTSMQLLVIPTQRET